MEDSKLFVVEDSKAHANITDTNSADYPISITRIKELLPSVALLNSSLALPTNSYKHSTLIFEMAMPSDTLF